MTLREFLSFIDGRDGRYELIDGRPVALANQTKRHDRIVNAVQARIYPSVSARGCDSYASGINVAVGRSSRSPDIVVTCDERDQRDDSDDESTRAVSHPRLIVEVLSPSTADVDLGPKLAEYQALPSLEEYLVIDSRRRWARLYRRDEARHLVFDIDCVGGLLVLESVGVEIDLDEVYGLARIRT
jgi:Uma2 family endonuclease